MTPLLSVFAAATIAWTIVSLVLSFRQSAFVRAHRNHVPADFAAAVTPHEHHHAADYAMARERSARVETLVDAAVTLAWAFGGIALVHGALAAVAAPSLPRSVAFLVATSLASTLVGLPFSLNRTFGLEKRFGFNRTTLATFLGDRLKGAVLSAAVGLPLPFALLWAMRALSGLWWFYAWMVLLAVMLVAPQRLRPVRRAALQSLPRPSPTRPCAPASRRSSNAPASTRPAFIPWTPRVAPPTATPSSSASAGPSGSCCSDTLLERSTHDEIEAIVAHELGHFLHRHVLFGLLRGRAHAVRGLGRVRLADPAALAAPAIRARRPP